MQFKFEKAALKEIVNGSLDINVIPWISTKISSIIENKSTKNLYLVYSLLVSKVSTDLVIYKEASQLTEYLKGQEMNALELARIYLLIEVLESDSAFFESKVANLIQVADTTELETFLKYLVLLPKPQAFKSVAVDALRTNISTVFNAIALNNPYPAAYFNEQQWNQMYLKAVFIESDLGAILSVDDRGNEDLSRIISDYAHERWAASRTINPLFWRPISKSLNKQLLLDIQCLFESDNLVENEAGALCCYNANAAEAKNMLNDYPELLSKIETGKLSWKNIKT